MDPSQPVTFRCKDAGFKNCDWQARGSTEEDVMKQVEEHGREVHNMDHLTPEIRAQVRQHIHRAA